MFSKSMCQKFCPQGSVSLQSFANHTGPPQADPLGKHPLGRHPPPKALRDTVNNQEVRILLEYILVYY